MFCLATIRIATIGFVAFAAVLRELCGSGF
jgi:hypothetical protein